MRVSVFLLALIMMAGTCPVLYGDAGVYAATPDKVKVVGTPTVYVQSGNDAIVSIQVKNNSGQILRGVNLVNNGFSSLEDYTTGNVIQGSSTFSYTDPRYEDSEEEAIYRFSPYFEKSGYEATDAVWDSSEEGYTIGAGKTATLWFKLRSGWESPGTYSEWLRFTDTHTEQISGIIPVDIVDEDLSGECPVNVVVYNPSGAAITMGTSSDGGHSINTVAPGSTIVFDSIDLSGSAGLTAEKTFYTRNTSTGYNGDITKDEHGFSSDIEVDLSVETPMLVQWSYDYPFGCNSHLLNGSSWAPLPAAPMNSNTWQAAQTGITLDASNYVSGTYSATFRLSTVPHGVKVNGGSIHTNGIYDWPVKVTLAGTNPRIPAAPVNIAETAGNGQVELTWSAAAGSPEKKEYYVYRREGSETAANKANLNTAAFNWDDYEYAGSDVTDDNGDCLFVDGTVENGKTYTYVIIGGTPYQAYPAISKAVTPKSSLSSRILAPYMGAGSEEIGGVLLYWSMNDVYGGRDNDGSSMVDHFNVYRDGVLIAQVQQNAVIEENTYGWHEVPSTVDPDTTDWVYGLTDTEYSWEYMAETPVPFQEYTWTVAAVSKSGVVGYMSDEDRRMGLADEIRIVNHNATAVVDGSEVYVDINGAGPYYSSNQGLHILSSYNVTPERVRYWRTEGTSAPDTSKAPVYTNYTPGYEVETAFRDADVRKGKTYTYTALADSGDGVESNYYTFTVTVPNPPSGVDWKEQVFTGAEVNYWNIIDGRKARLTWYPAYQDDEEGNWQYTGTYKVYRNGALKETYTAGGQDDGELIYEDDPGTDGRYVYRIDTVINGVTVTGREYIFVRNTATVDESTLLKAPGTPAFNVRVSDGIPVLRWAASTDGGVTEGYHIYRKDAGEYVNGTRKWSNSNWTVYYIDKRWSNKRYITIDDPDTTVLTDAGGYFQDDETKGMLESVSWYEDSCPHEYWITAYNQAGESEPSPVVTLTYEGETGLAPSNSDDHAPAAPVITDAWVEWDDESIYSTQWDNAIGGSIHVAWNDAASSTGIIDEWVAAFSGIRDESTASLAAWRAAKDPRETQGTGSNSPSAMINTGYGEYNDYGKTAGITVSAVNSAGSSSSEAYSLLITSFPRFRAWADSGRVKLEWTDLFEDTATQVTGWEIWRKGEASPWTRIKTFDGSLAPNETGTDHSNQEVSYYSWYDEDVTNNWTYEYKVVAKCSDGIDRSGTVRKATPLATASSDVPGAPRNLRFTKTNGEVTFTWDPPATGSPKYYQLVYEQTWSDGSKSWVEADSANVPSTSLTWTQTSTGTYLCFVYAYTYLGTEKVPCGADSWTTDDPDELYPSHSNIVTVTLDDADIDSQASDNPGGFTLTATPGSGKVTLNWTSSAGATYYEVERSVVGGEDTFLKVSLPSTVRSYTDDTAEPGARYSYTVTARNICGSSSCSVYAAATGKSKDEQIAEQVAALIEALPEPDDVGLDDEEAVMGIKEIWDGLTDRQQSLVPDELVARLLDDIDQIDLLKAASQYSEVAAEVQALIDALPDAEDITLSDKDAVEAARRAYNALPDPAKRLVLTGRLSAAEEKIALLEQYVADAAAAAAVTMQINALPASDSLTLEYKGAVEAARTAYEALNEQAKGMVTEETLSKLTTAENKIAELEQQARDQEAAASVTAQINELPAAAELTLGDKTAVEAARAAYEALNEQAKGMVTEETLSKLTTAENKIDELEQQARDQEAADIVMTQINDLPVADELTLADKTAVEAARAAYEALNDQAKGMVTEETLGKLTAAETKIALLEKQTADQAAADAVADLINALPYAGSVTADDAEAIGAARAAYNALTDDQKALLDQEELDILANCESVLEIRQQQANDQTAADNVIDAIGNIGGIISQANSIIDDITDLENELADLKAEKEQLNEELSGIDPDDPSLSEEERQALVDRIGEINGRISEIEARISEIGNTISELKDDLDDLEDQLDAIADAYNDLTPAQQALVGDAAGIISEAEQALGNAQMAADSFGKTEQEIESSQQANQAAANAVISMISDLPDIASIDPDDEAAVAAAREAVEAAREEYDRLTAAQKALVENAGALTAAEQALGQLVIDGQNAAINDISPVTELNAGMISIENVTYTGDELEPVVTVTVEGNALIRGTDYTVRFSNNVNAGTGIATVSGKGRYRGSVDKEFTILALAVTPDVTLSATLYAYNNAVKTPAVTVKVGSEILNNGDDYSVTFSGDRRSIGSYNVTVTLKGNYSGKRTVTFTIGPKATTVSKLSKAKKALTVKWKKQTSKMPKARITGYQIQYSTSSSFAGAKTVTVKGYKKASKKIKLKAKTLYYVRVRTYIKAGGKTYYSPWSAAKSAKTK